MSGFLLPDEELRLQAGSVVRNVEPAANSSFLLPGEQIASDRAVPVLRQAVAADPEKAARVRSISQSTGVPEPVTERNFDKVQTEAKLRELHDLMRTSPVLARQLTDPAFAKLAHDDALNLASVAGVVAKPTGPERAVTSEEFSRMVAETKRKNPTMDWDMARASVNARVVVDNSAGGISESKGPAPSFSSIATGLLTGAKEGGFVQVIEGARQWAGDLFGFETVSKDAARKGAQSQHRAELATPEIESTTGKDVYQGVQSTLQVVPGIALAIATANPALGLALLAGQSATPAYAKYRARGGSVGESSLGASLEGGAEAAGELLPMAFLVKKLGRVGMAQFVTGLLGREIPSEIATTIAQTATDTAIANPTKTWEQWAGELPAEIRSTVTGVLVQAALFAGAHKAINAMGGRAQAADNDAAALENLIKLAEASKVRQRDPQTFEQFVADAATDGPVQEIYVPAAVFAQAAGDNLAVFMQSMPSVGEQMDAALVGNSDLVIPVGEFAANVPGTGMEKLLIENARTSIDGISQAEAKTFLQSQVDDFTRQAEEIAAQAEFDSAISNAAATVENELFTQLETAGRFTKDVNTAYAMLAATFYKVQAQRLGITPDEMYVRYPLQIQATGAPGVMAFEQATRGQISFGETLAEPSVIQLLEHADLSTFTHEMGHFQLEVLADIAMQPGAPAEIVADMQKLFTWFGVKDMAAWQAMSLEQKRPHHEQLARGFEAYLFEGKAPAIELQGIFARFRAWMINVYRQLKSLNATLTDEVRGVFDRMVATNEQIIEAEAERSYAPLFKSAEEMGATPAEWQAYQALGHDATQEAVDLLQTRSLRNMAFAANARSRAIKALQKDAEVKRREIRIEARREILSDPVYQAWQFLTRRLGPDDKLPPERTKSRSETVDEFNDSLFAAIAKLGGLDREQVVSTWGTDPADRPTSGIFGKPVWRKTGGRSLDDMAEALGQYGYLTLDEHGKIDLADFEERFGAEVRGEKQYSTYYDYSRDEMRPGDQVVNPAGLAAGRFDLFSLRELKLPEETIARLQDLRMVAKDGLHPDIVAGIFGLTSGDELARKLADTEPPGSAIEGLTDQRMLERYGDLTDKKGIERAADAAVHNDVRARFIAAELRALAKATGNPKVFTKAAQAFAAQLIARKRVRDIKPHQYAAAEKRAAKAALAALQPIAPSDPDPVTKKMRNPGRKGGNLVEAATEKRNQLVNYYATKAAHEALAEVERAVQYLKKFDNEGTRKAINVDHLDQIDAILERFDLRPITNRTADKRASLAAWITAQEAAGIDPVIPDEIRNEAFRKPFKEMTLEEVRGVVDSVRNIEHVGRRWKELFTARDKREFEAVVADMADSIRTNAKGTVAERRASDRGFMVAAAALFRGFFAAHRKFASLAREMDGWKDAGTLWERLVWGMNDAGNAEAVAREQATIRLGELLKPVLAGGKMGEKRYFPTAGKSFTREERIGILLNMGNEVNQERIVTGERLTPAALAEILGTLTPADAAFAQAVWDYLDTFRPAIAAKERRLTGIEPEWVEAKPFQFTPAGGTTITLRGGYYPIKYDPLRSERSQADSAAEVQRQLERGLYTRAQTRRGHIKARTESTGRALRLDFGSVLASHVDQVVHDLSWHEYLIDANRLLRAGAVENAIREHYGPEKLQEMKKTLTDIAVGDLASQSSLDHVLNHLRHGATVAGLGWRVTTSLLQPLGLTQSVVRIGAKNVLRGAFHWAGDAVTLENSNRLIGEKSDFMRLRAKTMQREINEIRNKVAGGDSKIEASYFYLIQKMQLVADIPTWWGAYEGAMRGSDMTEEKAVALADQAVRDAQGSGQIGDLAGIQRGHAGLKLFTNFYSFFNTTYNLTREAIGRADFTKPGDYPLLAADLLLLYTVPAILGTLMKATLAGDWDDEEKLARRLVADQLNYLLGTVVLLREGGSALQAALGLTGDYGGPASVRFFADLAKFAKQAEQGDPDEAFWKSLNNVGGTVFHYPSGQINATIDGINALVTGKTENPGALFVGSNRN